MDSISILERLVEFPTVSRDSNLALISYVADLLQQHGIASRLVPSPDGSKASLIATAGPTDRPGVMLSGHTDVVPVDGQNWSLPPFTMTKRDGKLYGRGTADMKGFVACLLAMAIRASKTNLVTPLQLALSYDEEIGCVGVHGLIDDLVARQQRPLLCIVGEPTNMQVAIGHKGKMAVRAVFKGREAHSALAPLALNAIHLGADFIRALQREQEWLQEHGATDEGYDIPYTTVHAGLMHGGVALNIVPNLCTIDFEIRNVAAEYPKAILKRLETAAGKIIAEAKAKAPEADVAFEVFNFYPGLDNPADCPSVAFVKSLIGRNDTMKVAFGTEAGLFCEKLRVPTVICGPGSMAQGHKPDEYVLADQLSACDAMLDKLLRALETGTPDSLSLSGVLHRTHPGP
ncbi:acetylornithine deacetylase [Ensifer sp. YR511]|uniref:acetylornithine deacetylase n=1 Tax=Ensifer sp. YR511 TaxID=1855294 RepID=UPI000885E6CC|nr:acetylornithine deacetylase [Ensifer sp. YR511]SDN71007.1 acetylornithine deacetylase [Ensifer sp. YR511]